MKKWAHNFIYLLFFLFLIYLFSYLSHLDCRGYGLRLMTKWLCSNNFDILFQTRNIIALAWSFTERWNHMKLGALWSTIKLALEIRTLIKSNTKTRLNLIYYYYYYYYRWLKIGKLETNIFLLYFIFCWENVSLSILQEMAEVISLFSWVLVETKCLNTINEPIKLTPQS